MMMSTYKALVRALGAFGAHPDDMEFDIGATAAMWAAQGHHVKIVSMTNGDQGHYEMSGGALAKRRKAEVEEVARRLGIDETLVLDNPDGYLEPSVKNRRMMIHLIRDWQADIVISHRRLTETGDDLPRLADPFYVHLRAAASQASMRRSNQDWLAPATATTP